MDERPFLQFSLLDMDERIAHELERFSKNKFDVEAIIATASDLKYLNGIRRILAEEWSNPSDEFVRTLAGRVYNGRFTQSVMEQFREIVKRGLCDFITNRVNDRLAQAIEQTQTNESSRNDDSTVESKTDIESGNGIVTTEDEIEGFYIVKSIVSSEFDPRRVFIRDTQSYCGVLFDDNNRKPLCRLRFNHSQKYLETFSADKQSNRHPIEDVQDIYKHCDEIIRVARSYNQDNSA